ncbi:hypothetical protein SUNI508_08709 [Seiridium unicorne]|uniref:Glycine zipper 2TM domain-containing protein n=1 Tax=Seiridium unicorne TaxID=138068 RepID=A0ABR2USC0_9PEZI
MSRYDDRGRPFRDRSPDYAYAGGSGVPPRVPSPGHTAFIPPAAGSHARLEYEPQTPFYPPPPPNYNNLQVPETRARPRSLPPPADYRRSRSRHGRGRDDDDHYDDRSRDRSPIGKAKKVLENTFTDSTTGLGVGVLGALVGGLAAHEAAEATSRHGGGHHNDAQRRNQLLSTVVGAAVGALGANAVEKRLELNREKTNVKQDKWEQKWGRRSGDGIDRPRSGGGGRNELDLEAGDDGYGRRSRPGSRGLQREVDPDARSWKNVEDWVYDSRDGDRSRDRRGRRSEDAYRY